MKQPLNIDFYTPNEAGLTTAPIAVINDGPRIVRGCEYTQKTPKKRVLAYLIDVKTGKNK